MYRRSRVRKDLILCLECFETFLPSHCREEGILPAMSVKTPIEGPSTGFDFTNYARNQFLGERFGGLPKGEF